MPFDDAESVSDYRGFCFANMFMNSRLASTWPFVLLPRPPAMHRASIDQILQRLFEGHLAIEIEKSRQTTSEARAAQKPRGQIVSG
ncbi:hypothetical protein G6N74_05710 [Mesorhizobium sp. CGMCC 1.15528]|uniref:Uncharacterized protein n=1 Tax=Mesorhizobium zhangyense TaxID=1776730 RepID=A0A7C9R822_9HYPH|nr:hypothetical protein [Mesorhizobium zhangyense]NGN40553.1 hypothetical protein [Mesorhizobium zhangyense]